MRAAIAATPEEFEFTSIYERILQILEFPVFCISYERLNALFYLHIRYKKPVLRRELQRLIIAVHHAPSPTPPAPPRAGSHEVLHQREKANRKS